MAEDSNKDDDGDSGGGGLGNILGAISPLYGMLSGDGMFGKLAGSGAMGLMPALMAKKKKKPGQPPAPGEPPVPAMAKGGRVKPDKVRGKTNGPPFGKPKIKTKAPNPFGKKPKGTGTMAPPFTKKFAKGGSVRGDGCASRGRTKGSMR